MVLVFAAVRVVLMVCLLDHSGVWAQLKEAEVSNYWATYYEQPCCATKRHVRHHKGKTPLPFQTSIDRISDSPWPLPFLALEVRFVY